MADHQPVDLPREGQLRAQPLATLLGGLGLVRATGALDLTRRRLTRRFVLELGRLEALVSNAREDRFLDWLVVRGELADQAPSSVQAALAELGATPLSAGVVLRHGWLPAERLRPLLREHLLSALEESTRWADGGFAIRPGRVNLGTEPTAGWSAVSAALTLARAAPSDPRRAELPHSPVIARAPLEELAEVDWRPSEHDVFAACANGLHPRDLGQRVCGCSPAEAQLALAVLWRAGLVVAAPVAAEAPSAPELVTSEALDRWLAAAAEEDFATLLGAPVGAEPAVVRRAYYRTVRRFHPDRFREGPFATRHREIEQAFHLVHEALELLTNPQARAEREARRRTPAPTVRDQTQLAAEHADRARAALAGGRRAEAVTLLERAIAAAPEEPGHRVQLALLLTANPAKRPQALATLEALAKEHPGRADILAAAALALTRAGRSAESALLLKRAHALDAQQLLVRALSGDPASVTEARRDPLFQLFL